MVKIDTLNYYIIKRFEAVKIITQFESLSNFQEIENRPNLFKYNLPDGRIIVIPSSQTYGKDYPSFVIKNSEAFDYLYFNEKFIIDNHFLTEDELFYLNFPDCNVDYKMIKKWLDSSLKLNSELIELDDSYFNSCFDKFLKQKKISYNSKLYFSILYAVHLSSKNDYKLIWESKFRIYNQTLSFYLIKNNEDVGIFQQIMIFFKHKNLMSYEFFKSFLKI